MKEPEINKHALLQNKAMTWAGYRGFDVVDHEASVGETADQKTWVADVVGIGVIYPTAEKKLRLKEPVCKQERCEGKYGFEELYTNCPLLTACFEVKVSRADYTKDIGRKFSLFPCHLNYIVTTRKLLKPEEVPDGWGLLEESGQGLRIIVSPDVKEVDPESSFSQAYVLALKEKNRELREFSRNRQRSTQAYNAASRVTRVLSVMAKYVFRCDEYYSGTWDEPEEYFEFCGLPKPSDVDIEYIRKLRALTEEPDNQKNIELEKEIKKLKNDKFNLEMTNRGLERKIERSKP